MPNPDQEFIARIKQMAPVTPLKGITNQRVDNAMLKLPPVTIASEPTEQVQSFEIPQRDYQSEARQANDNRGYEALGNIFGALAGHGPNSSSEYFNKMRERNLHEADRLEAEDPNSNKSQMFRDLATKLGVPVQATHSAADISSVISPYQNLYNQDSKLASLMAKLNARKNGIPTAKPVLKGKEFEEVANMRGALDAMNATGNDILGSETKTGLSTGLQAKLPRMFQNPNVAEMDAKQALINQAHARMTSGKTVSDKERAILEQTLPSVSDPPDVFNRKMKAYLDISNGLLNSRLDAHELNNQPVSQFRWQKKDIAPSVKTKAPVWTDDKEKRYQELKAKAGK